VRKVIDALGAIRARIEFGTAELNLFLAELTSEARQTTASVRLDTIHTSSIVLALVLLAVVNIHFASRARVAGKAFATETTFFEDRAHAAIATRIAIASVNHMFAMLSMIAGSATTFVLTFRSHSTLAVVLAREREAGIAFRQNLIADFLFANELVGWRRENQFVLHTFRLGTASNARLNVIHFHPFR